MTLSRADLVQIEQTEPSALDPAARDDLPVTWFCRDDGTFQVISRYGDDVWRFPHSRFAAGIQENERRCDFRNVAAAFRPAVKAIVRRWDVEGRPRGQTLVGRFNAARHFIAYLDRVQVNDLSRVSAMHCANYVAHCRSLTTHQGKPLAPGTMALRFAAVEILHLWALGTPYAFPNPWPDASAALLAGLTGQGAPESTTLIIPDEALSALFRAAVDHLAEAERLFDGFTALETERTVAIGAGLGSYKIYDRLNRLAKSMGFRDKPAFNTAYGDLLPAAAVVILTLSGIRIHELCYLRALPEHGGKAWYSTTNEDGDRVYWMASRSDKTGEGETEWLVPELVTQALDVATRYAQPLQAQLEQQLADSPESPATAAKRAHRTSLFLGQSTQKNNDVTGSSADEIRRRIHQFATSRGVAWKFTPHQFRRTFAVYVAKSAYGDLRYLRQHFKHWSLDMTALYALNEKQDADLYDEVMTAVIAEKIAVVTHWLDEDTLLSGGGSEAIRTFRSRDETLRTYKDRKAMATKMSDLIHLRASGSGWCTADDGGCGGRSLVERTRCGDCVNAVIDERHLKRWAAIYQQQLELREIDDLGSAAEARIERDIARCEQVLRELGALEAVQTAATELQETQ